MSIRKYLFEPSGIALAGLISIAFYTVWSIVHRLYLGPLAKFPGPKLAALTQWVESYYELFHGEGGQYLFQYRKWHEQYGPIVRISPTEVHIDDATFFEGFYSIKHGDRRLEYQDRFFNRHATFQTTSHVLHRIRRAALSPFFAKRKIYDTVPMIQELMDQICARLNSDEYKGMQRPICITRVWSSFTADVIVRCAFDKDYHFIEAPGFNSEFTKGFDNAAEPIHIAMQFPTIFGLMGYLPEWVMRKLQPNLAAAFDFQKELEKLIDGVLEQQRLGTKGSRNTIFDTILDANLPPQEVTKERLLHESLSIVPAGLETTARALTVAIYHILSTPSIHSRLLKELEDAIPDSSTMPSWDELMRLPYLSACIDESLRLGYGVSGRNPRVFDTPIQYKEWTIPAGTVISMDNYSQSHSEDAFPDSFTYNPERWLGDPVGPEGKPLSRFLSAFGKGPHACLGMQLAYADLFIGLATMMRRVKLELYETTRMDVDCTRDRLVPRPPKSSLGVRVIVK